MAKTRPEPVRDQRTDHLLTPQNCILALIDYQPEQFGTITSTTQDRINLNVIALCRSAMKYNVPVVLSTVGVDLGANSGTVQTIRDELPGIEEIDRTGVNAWEDEDFRSTVISTGRRKVVVAGLWTEVCLAYPTLDMLAAGYDVYPVADAVGGISLDSHHWALQRMIAAGATPITAMAFGAELMRDWARTDSDNLREVMKWYFPRKQELDQIEG